MGSSDAGRLRTDTFGRYVQRYGLAEACDNIEPVLRRVALAQGKTQKVKVLTGTGECSGGGSLRPGAWGAGFWGS